MSFHASYFWLSVLSGGRKARSECRSPGIDHEGSLCCHVEVIARGADEAGDDGGDDGDSAMALVSGGEGWKCKWVRPLSAVITDADDDCASIACLGTCPGEIRILFLLLLTVSASTRLKNSRYLGPTF